MGNALVKAEPAVPTEWLPVMSIDQAVGRYQQMVAFVKHALHDGTDYGRIPGTGDKAKPTLLKPGAEKLCTFFGLRKVPVLLEKDEDWTGEKHAGEAFFYYSYRYELYRGDVMIAAADGSCNSWEKKYRWRQGDRVCPLCEQPAIFKSKKDGGWFCWSKKGGCGANFSAGDPAIESQQVGRVPNADPADVVNTIQKMAQKRALIAATLLAVNASDYFTQDLEDHVAEDGEVIEGAPVQEPNRGESRRAQRPSGSAAPAPPANKPAPQDNMPRSGPELRERLGNYDAQLVGQKICGKGELLSAVSKAGVDQGWSDDLAAWSEREQFEFAVAEARRFVEAKKQAGNGRPANGEPSSADVDGVRLENWLRERGRYAAAEAGVCEKDNELLDYIRDEGEKSGLSREIARWKGLDIDTAVKLSKKWIKDRVEKAEKEAELQPVG